MVTGYALGFRSYILFRLSYRLLDAYTGTSAASTNTLRAEIWPPYHKGFYLAARSHCFTRLCLISVARRGESVFTDVTIIMYTYVVNCTSINKQRLRTILCVLPCSFKRYDPVHYRQYFQSSVVKSENVFFFFFSVHVKVPLFVHR